MHKQALFSVLLTTNLSTYEIDKKSSADIPTQIAAPTKKSATHSSNEKKLENILLDKESQPRNKGMGELPNAPLFIVHKDHELQPSKL